MNKLGQASGFTIIELMVATAVLGVIVAIGVPSFSTMIKNNRMAAMANDLNSTLQYARAEAVRRGGGVRVSALSGDVNNGLQVWIDDGNNNFESGEELRVFRADLGNFTLDAKEGAVGNQNLSFTFNARGFASDLSSNVTIDLCDERVGSYGRQVTLLTSGLVRLTTNFVCAGSEE